MVIIQIAFLALAASLCEKSAAAQNVYVRTLVPVSEKCTSKSCSSCSSTIDDLSSLLLLAKALNNDKPCCTTTCNDLKADDIIRQLVDALVTTTTKTVAAANQNIGCSATSVPLNYGGQGGNDLLGLLGSSSEGLIPQLLGLLLGSSSSGALLNLGGSKDLPIVCINGHKMLYLGKDNGGTGSCVSSSGIPAETTGTVSELLKSL